MRTVVVLLSLLCIFSISYGQVGTEPDVIRFATMNSEYKPALEEIIRRYEQLHPNIRVELTVIHREFETWIRSRMAAGGDIVPDIYNSNFTHGYDRLGKWVCLDDWLSSVNPYTSKPWQDTFDMSIARRYRYAGKFYQLPLDYIDIAIFYNKKIFNELGLSVPTNWEEFLATCEKIKKVGYAPLAIGGDAESFWSGSMGWLVRLFCDAYLRDYLPLVASRLGDHDYDSSQLADYKYDPDDPYYDMMVGLNAERILNAVLDKRIAFQSERFKRIYVRLKELSQYFQPGYLGQDDRLTPELFYKQKAAMAVFPSINITSLERDLKEIGSELGFEVGNFWFPPITEDPLCCGSFRGVGGGGMVLAVTKKDSPEHERNVIDFLMYLSSPQSGKVLVERTIAEDKDLIGPLLIKGVGLPEHLAKRYEVFMGHGFEKIGFRGLMDEQESVSEWVVIAQEYFAGRLSLDDFTEQYQQIMHRAALRIKARYGYDLDPTTTDKPPDRTLHKNKLNPFENGSLMLAILAILYGAYASYYIKKSRGQARSRTVVAFLMLAPTFLLVGAFNYFPALSGLYHAFTEWEEGRNATFCGLDNFTKLISDKAFYAGAWNMLVLLITALLKATVVPFIAAQMILHLFNSRLRYIFRTMFLLPMVVPGMVLILLWKFIYSPNTGLLNNALMAIGLENLTASWLGEPSLALPAIVFVGFPWVGAFGLLIYMAGLMNIPSSIREAYTLESDSILRRVVSIDIPLVNGQTRLLIILAFITSLQEFQAILIMTRGGPGLSTVVPALRMYYQAFTFGHFGYGAAIGFVLFLAILLATLLCLKVFKPSEEL